MDSKKVLGKKRNTFEAHNTQSSRIMARSYQCLLLHVTTFVFLDGFGKLEKFLWTAELLRLACFYTRKQKNRERQGLPFLSSKCSLKVESEKGLVQKDLYTCPEDFRLIMGRALRLPANWLQERGGSRTPA